LSTFKFVFMSLISIFTKALKRHLNKCSIKVWNKFCIWIFSLSSYFLQRLWYCGLRSCDGKVCFTITACAWITSLIAFIVVCAK
jgi:hypothetical protein